ncbi:hypothetical protein PhCBS80983_g05453 [Powellomyces hirtus]|uniref:cysteine synthase n=1 Tax=Powellomyces hirtus TaxID=109895 RepID=A0A507DU47_9FUNG|nr:hypothetical protein PhCBS80983_g05453 [Powellomyces hirtus]
MLDRTSLALGLLVGASISAASCVLFLLSTTHRPRPRARLPRPKSFRQSTFNLGIKTDDIRDGVAGLIGDTPLFRISSLSEATGCEILAKAEFMNVGGSTKDRVALGIIDEAEAHGHIVPHRGDTIFEGTVGSTGISLAVIARARGYLCHIVMPDDQAQEKYDLLEKLGATVEKVRPVSIVDRNHFVNLARRRAADMNREADRLDAEAEAASGSVSPSVSGTTTPETSTKKAPRGYFCDQFENLANFNTHYATTAPELYSQTNGQIDALVLGAGTGGTLAGLTRYLKPRIRKLLVVLADPTGSGLYHKIKHGIMYAPTEQEGKRKRHQVDTVVEGVGINRLTKNFEKIVAGGYVDEAVHVNDREAVEMSRYLVRKDGLFVGSSSAVNCVAAVRVARQLGPGHTIVTMICDHGTRHLTKFWSDSYIEAQGLTPRATGLEFLEDRPAPELFVQIA